jgi:hypothetical protein
MSIYYAGRTVALAYPVRARPLSRVRIREAWAPDLLEVAGPSINIYYDVALRQTNAGLIERHPSTTSGLRKDRSMGPIWKVVNVVLIHKKSPNVTMELYMIGCRGQRWSQSD